MSEGLELEWILEKKDCGLHHRNLARDQPNPNSQVQYADLHGPDEQCRIVLLLSYPAVSAGVRPMMLNLCRSRAMGVHSTLHNDTILSIAPNSCIESPVSSKFAPSAVYLIGLRSRGNFTSVQRQVMNYSKDMFDHLLTLIPREKILCPLLLVPSRRKATLHPGGHRCHSCL